MARTFAVTKTITVARLELLKMQVSIALRRSANADQKGLDAVNKGLDKKWIKRVTVYGFDSQKLCRAQLDLEIDWNEHTIQLSRGKAHVTIDGRWEDSTAIEVDQAVQLFNKWVETNMLRTEWVISYAPHLNRDEINRALGFKPADPVRWAGEGVGVDLDIPELPELRVGLRAL
jgi:hypothetical protein